MKMSDKQNMNLSLLTQSEIDTLVGFLIEKKDGVDSSVLSQTSIDKLIELLRFDERRRKTVVLEESIPLDGAMADLVRVRGSEEDVCELCCEVGDVLTLSVTNRQNGNSMELTPEMINEGDGSDWGRCMPPLTLNKLARALDVKYSTQTYENVLQRYAECLYGDGTKQLPVVYLPVDEDLIKTLL
jgi:hypothetical protein